jgi:L-lactate utilization protein LutC
MVSKINLTPTNIRMSAQKIDLIGATTFRSGVNTDYITINENTFMFQENSTGAVKMAMGFVPDRNGINIPGIVLGGGSGQGNNRGYITKDVDSLDIFYISGTGVVNYMSLDESGIKLNDKIIPVADQNGKLVDGYIGSASTWNDKINEATMKARLQDPTLGIDIPKQNIGVLDGANLENLSIGTAHIKDANITNAKIENATITSAKIADATITSAKIGLAEIKTANIADANITNAKIVDATIQGAKIANATIVNANIQDATITGAKIGLATIGTANIVTGSITNALIGTGAIETAQIANGSITDAKIVELTANKITAGTLSVERLVIRDPVTPSKSLIYSINNISGALQSVQGDTLNGEILTPRTITADRIVVGAITANEIAVATITANKLVANTITAGQIAVGTITATEIATGTITANKMVAGTITASSGIIGSIDAGTITAGSLTGRVVRTAESGERIELSTNTLSAYNTSGQLHGFVMTKATGFNQTMGGFYNAGVQTLEFFNNGTTGYALVPLNGAKLGLGANGSITEMNGDIDVLNQISWKMKTGTLGAKPTGLKSPELWWDTGNKIIVTHYLGTHYDAFGAIV